MKSSFVVLALLSFLCGSAAAQTQGQNAYLEQYMRQAEEISHGQAFGRIQKSREREVFWAEGLYAEIIEHPNCRGYKTQVHSNGRGPYYTSRMSKMMMDIRTQATISGCIQRASGVNPNARRLR